MVKTVCIGGAEITIRQLMKKEFRPLAIALAERFDGFLEITNAGAPVKTLTEFFCANLDFICSELILPFTDLTPAQLEETAVTDIIRLLRELLEYNGIPVERIINFFETAVPGQETERSARTPGFGGTAVPLRS